MTLLGVLPQKNPLTNWNKIGMGDYVGDATQYPKWHVDRFRGVIPTKGWNVNGLCFFFVCSSAQLGVKPLDRFWRVMSQNACFWKYCIPLGVRTTRSQFQWVEILKNRQKLARIGIFQPKCQNLTMAISIGTNSKIQNYALPGSRDLLFKFSDPLTSPQRLRYKPKILHAEWKFWKICQKGASHDLLFNFGTRISGTT